MKNKNTKTNYTWKGRSIDINRMFRKIRKSKRAVSPVIAIVLLIALTVAAAAVVWTLTSGILDDPSVELVLDNYGVADTDGDKEGDLIELHIRNLGADDAKITEVKLFRDESQQASWLPRWFSLITSGGACGGLSHTWSPTSGCLSSSCRTILTRLFG